VLEEALSQGTCRLPSATDISESLSKLSPLIILNQISRPMFSKLPFTHHAETTSAKLKNNTDKCLLSIAKEKLHFRKMNTLNSFGYI